MTKEDLIKEALVARECSYSPYSHFKVGAALLCKDGTIYHGANIENASYPLCMCAERNALYNAYCHGKKKEDLVALALIADTKQPCSPCGACRQVISELLPREGKIYMGTTQSNEIKEVSIDDLLPYAFDDSDL